MAEKILEEFKQKVTGLEMQPSSGGCYEVTVDNKVVYSKLETGEFPADHDIIDALKKLAT